MLGCAFPSLAFAHEAYVEDRVYFWNALGTPSQVNVWQTMADPHDRLIAVTVTLAILIVLIANFFFLRSAHSRRINNWLEQYSYLGPLFVRLTFAATLCFSANFKSFYGPELTLSQLPAASTQQALLFITGVAIAFGALTEFAAFIALVMFVIASAVFGTYMANYANYLGEIIALVLFGARKWTVDGKLFGLHWDWRRKFEDWEVVIIRIFYGLALLYAAITVKFFHPEITIKVVNDWNLTQFHWLFPSDPHLVVLGSGLAEAAVGLFILIGFQLRLTVLVSLFYITLSLLFFREAVWPHLLLYGISLDLLLQPTHFSVDGWLFGKRKKAGSESHLSFITPYERDE
jgi:uncharacterized membrane protein YphA (DoxX/SURF4 family)